MTRELLGRAVWETLLQTLQARSTVYSRRLMTFEELLAQIPINVANSRTRVSASATATIESLEDGQGRTGEFFVRQLGAIVSFENGRSEHIYNSHAAAMRNRVVGDQAAAREKYFTQLFEQIPADASVLNIGAGGDFALIRSIYTRTRCVLSMDFDEEVAALLRKEGHRAVAFDLSQVEEVLPCPVDCVVGNSVLGYIDPARLSKIVQQLTKRISQGAIFTFDLAPHGKYFRIADAASEAGVANESSVSPGTLLRFIQRMGAEQGVDAWAHFAWARGMATDYAVLRAIAQLFEAEGFTANLSQVDGVDDGLPGVWVLRVAPSPDSPTLTPSPIERAVGDAELTAALMNGAVWTPLLFIDRSTGVRLARALGLPGDERSSAWLVAEHVANQQDCKRLRQEALLANISGLDVPGRIARIGAAIRSGVIPPCRPLDRLIAMDQTLHKLVLKGEVPLTVEQADLRLDVLYAQAREQALSKRTEDAKRDERRRKKDARKRSRR